MTSHKKEITKEQYDKAMKTNGYVSSELECELFNDCERWGYGVYCARVYEENNTYYVRYSLGSSCD